MSGYFVFDSLNVLPSHCNAPSYIVATVAAIKLRTCYASGALVLKAIEKFRVLRVNQKLRVQKSNLNCLILEKDSLSHAHTF